MLTGRILPVPACTRCQHCIGTYYRAVKLTALVTSFAYRPSSALLRCLLSLFLPRSACFRSFLDALGVPHVPAVVPDSLVGPLLEGVGEEELVRRRTGEEGEEWRMWEEVDGWCTAAVHAWPAVEAWGAAAALLSGAGRRAGGVDGEELEECCAGMRHAMWGNVAIASERRQALKSMVAAAGDAGASGANEGWGNGEAGGGGSGEGRRGKPVASYQEPWLGGGESSGVFEGDAAGGDQLPPPGSGGCRYCRRRCCCCSSWVEGEGLQLKVCARCGKAAYCSRECQKAHWPSRKLMCLPKGKEKADELINDCNEGY
ncbi:unnamed protein product [Closterium sp. NIES-54]